MRHVLPASATVDDRDRLTIGGCDAVVLAQRFGTPLIVVCRETIEARASAFTSTISPDRVVYAAKAFCTAAICELMSHLGLSLDVCTGGELATALAAGFPPDRIVFHGNNKSETEIVEGRDAGVGRFVADSFTELDRLDALGVEASLLLRVTPGVEAHTHEYVKTGQEDSKFGFGLNDGVAFAAMKRALSLRGPKLVGVHAHIGSQILDLEPFDVAVGRIAEFLATVHAELGFTAAELNLGGGFGIAHTAEETTLDPAEAAARLRDVVSSHFEGRGLPVPDLYLEPGRALVGSAAVTLYEVGTVKTIPGIRTYVAVDGGMSDNPRYPLYGARYETFLANRVHAEPNLAVTVAGKHCESGDVLIKDTQLPRDVGPGDLLCIPATGAYTYSMASNYNRVTRPAVVLVSAGEATEIVSRETYDDLLAKDRRLDGSALRDVG